GDQVAEAGALRPDARAHRVDRRLVGRDRDLRAVPRLSGHGLDLDDPLGDLGHPELEQLLEQPRVGPRDDDLWPLGALAHLGDVALEPFAVAVGLAGHLLGLREERFDLARIEPSVTTPPPRVCGRARRPPGLRGERFDLAEIEQRVPTLRLLDDAGHDVALAAGELLVRHLAFGVT